MDSGGQFGTLGGVTRRFFLAGSILLLAVACGETTPGEEGTPVTATPAAGPVETTAPPPTGTDPSATTAPPAADTTAPSVTDTTAVTYATVPSASAAPDFTLALGDGGTFMLSAETRPVFMIFWAEW